MWTKQNHVTQTNDFNWTRHNSQELSLRPNVWFTTTILRPFVRDYSGEMIPEETFTHSHPSWSSIILYLLPPSTTIHSILPVQFTCLTFFLHNLSPSPPLLGLPLGLAPSTSNSIHFLTQSLWWLHNMKTYRKSQNKPLTSDYCSVERETWMLTMTPNLLKYSLRVEMLLTADGTPLTSKEFTPLTSGPVASGLVAGLTSVDTSLTHALDNIYSWHVELNSLYNVYFGFLIFWKLIELLSFYNLFRERAL